MKGLWRVAALGAVAAAAAVIAYKCVEWQTEDGAKNVSPESTGAGTADEAVNPEAIVEEASECGTGAAEETSAEVEATEETCDSVSSVTSDAEAASVVEKVDYSKPYNWYQIPRVTKDVDTFYIYSTLYMGLNEGDADYATIDNPEMVQGVVGEYVTQASAYEDATNLYVPYYRQAGMGVGGKAWKETGNIDRAICGVPYGDICAALDYYFENYNEGRPFILAGHSQGSAIAKLVLKGYFKEHPAYYERMVAAYLIGYSVTKEDLEEYPHLKFATGEADTGVIVSWNTEGEENVATNATNFVVLPNEISINPLNWKLDDTYAPASENLGSLVFNESAFECQIGDMGADAQIDLERGVVVTHATCEPIAMPEFFGPESFHDDDYTLYYNNIKDNVAKRIAAYQENQ